MSDNRPKRDDRSDNVEKLQEMVQNTIGNLREAEETMQHSDGEQRANIAAKNDRRRDSIAAMREEIKDEAADQGKSE